MEPWPLYNEVVCSVRKRELQQRRKVPFSARNFPFRTKKKRMASQQMFKSGQTKGAGQARADKVMESAQGTADAARDKASQAAQSTQQCKEEGTGMLHQTGERAMNMVQGAVDSVKSTLGMGDSNKKS